MEELRTIKQCIKGVKSAQRDIYVKYRRIWYFICLRYAADEEDANDMLQNALVKIYSNLRSFDHKKGTFRGWSSSIVINECLMFLRKRKGVREHREKYERSAIPANTPTIVSNMTAREILLLVQELPDGYRAVFNLYALEGYTHKEISERLDISIGTSKSQLHKARKILQKMISEIFEVVSP